MPTLYGPRGEKLRTVAEVAENYKKASPPKTGAMGPWAGQDIQYMSLPGGGILQFDLNKLTLDDYRSMKDHYQVNANLALLNFMHHQIEWRITGPNGEKPANKKQAEFVEGVLRKVWTRLCRAMGQAHWAGYSPNVLEYENQDTKFVLNKVKDLVPEFAEPNWKTVEGWAPQGRPKPKVKIFDGIKVRGMNWPIPNDNSFWYPLLMENGDMWGKKLLRPAFPSWFFSILLHLFSNRYFERFGEPVPIGRAPEGAEVEIGGANMEARQAMELIVRQLRNRSVVVLPSTRTPVGLNSTGVPPYDYDIEYLESQMRGADFERYMTRLDEEISLALFTPILLLRVADVGSYNLGTGHTQLFLWMLNALEMDRKEYIDRYIVTPLKNFNFGENAPDLEWTFKPMGKHNVETLRAVVTEIIRGGRAKPDLDQLGDAIGLSLDEIKQLNPANDPAPGPGAPGPNDPGAPAPDNRGPRDKPKVSRDTGSPKKTTARIAERISGQVYKAFRDGTVGEKEIKLGFRREFEEALSECGFAHPHEVAENFYGTMNGWIAEVLQPGIWETPESFVTGLSNVMDDEVQGLFDAT